MNVVVILSGGNVSDEVKLLLLERIFSLESVSVTVTVAVRFGLGFGKEWLDVEDFRIIDRDCVIVCVSVHVAQRLRNVFSKLVRSVDVKTRS